MTKHDFSSIIGKIKMKLKLINILISQNNNSTASEQLERITELLNQLKEAHQKL